MSTSFERRFSSANLGTLAPRQWDLFVRTLDARLKAVEEKKAAFEEATRQVESLAIARIDEALLPAFNAIQTLAHLGAIFEARSETALEIVGGGEIQLTIVPATRDIYAPTRGVAITRFADHSVGMIGRTVDYHRPTGTLTVAIDAGAGEGVFNDWVVAPSAGFIEGVSQADFDAGLAALVGGAPGSLDTLGKLAAAINDDPGFAATVASEIAASSAAAVASAVAMVTGGAPGALDTLAEIAAAIGNDPDFASSVDEAIDQNVIPPGTTALFYQANAPVGWTKVTTHDNKALRVVSGAGGGAAGTHTFTTVFGKTTTDGHTLTEAQLAAHRHDVSNQVSSTSATGGQDRLTGNGSGTLSGLTGGGQAHSHGMDIRVQYIDVILATRDGS